MARMQIGALLTLLVLAASAASAEERKDEKKEEQKKAVKIEVGKPAPDFTLKDENGKDVKLSDFRLKKRVLIAFYPKDFTSG